MPSLALEDDGGPGQGVGPGGAPGAVNASQTVDPQDLRVALLRVLGDPTGTLGRLGLPGSAARAIPGSAASGSTGVGAPALATLGSLGVLGPARGPASAASANSALGPALWLNESTATHPLPPWPLFFDVVLPDRVRDGTHAGHVGHVGHALPTAAQPDCCYPFTDVVEFLHQYYVPVMIVMGLVGNLLSCVVFLNTHLRLRSSSYYLAALATADFGYLAVLVLVWLNSMHGVQVFDREGWCQVITYVSSVCAFLSVWLIVAFTVERFIAVQYPLHRPHMCTVARAKAIVGCIAAFALVAHIYTLKTRGMVRDKDGYESCEMLDQHRDVMRVINLVDAIVTLVVPIILIIVMNTMITRNLVLFGRRFKQAGPGADLTVNSWTDAPLGHESASCDSSSGTGAAPRRGATASPIGPAKAGKVGKVAKPAKPGRARRLAAQATKAGAKGLLVPAMAASSAGPAVTTTLETNTQAAADPPDITMGLGGLGGLGQRHHYAATGHSAAGSTTCGPSAVAVRAKQQPIQISTGRTLVSTRTQQSITKMLLLISSVFIALNLPSHVLRVYASIAMFTGSNVDMTTSPALWFGQQVAMLLYYTNFSINFLLYSMCGITFRRCLWQLVRNVGRYFGCGCGSRWSECQFR